MRTATKRKRLRSGYKMREEPQPEPEPFDEHDFEQQFDQTEPEEPEVRPTP